MLFNRLLNLTKIAFWVNCARAVSALRVRLRAKKTSARRSYGICIECAEVNCCSDAGSHSLKTSRALVPAGTNAQARKRKVGVESQRPALHGGEVSWRMVFCQAGVLDGTVSGAVNLGDLEEAHRRFFAGSPANSKLQVRNM
jgi:hypothetical protein